MRAQILGELFWWSRAYLFTREWHKVGTRCNRLHE
jgi:hypothetical protein